MRLLDLFCGAGGAAMGYHRAGFEVVGVDINPQPHYPFEFHQADALTYPLDGFDAIHASPPCQRYSRTASGTGKGHEHPDLLQSTIDILTRWGGPWAVENVDGAPFPWALGMCGWGFGLPFHRHRYFMLHEWSLQHHHGCPGPQTRGVSIDAYTYGPQQEGEKRRLMEAMGVDWMPSFDEASQAIPPAYTEHIGRQLMRYLETR